MDDVEACAISPCANRPVVTLPLMVEGHESLVAVCEAHADWLRRYVEEDSGVQEIAEGDTDEGAVG
jgi:hypothetical protein